jgi:hypothetical protein
MMVHLALTATANESSLLLGMEIRLSNGEEQTDFLEIFRIDQRILAWPVCLELHRDQTIFQF